MSEALFDPTLKKKKKSTKAKPAFAAEEEAPAVPVDAPPADKLADLWVGGDGGDFDFKKKKKKKSSTKTAADDFDAQLQEAGIEVAAAKEQTPEAVEDPTIAYEQLLSRFFAILREQNPEMAGDRVGVKYKIPLPVVQREGNKKTAFANIKMIADKMHRPTEHVIHFLFTELGTSGSVDGAQRLVIKGRFQQKQIENVLRRYILEYVTCKTCKSVNTRLTKENRLYFLDCNSCGSRRSVQSIKAGYQAVTRQARQRAKAV